MKFVEGTVSGNVGLKGPTNEVKYLLKQYPGCLWNSEKFMWTVPSELVDHLKDASSELGVAFSDTTKPSSERDELQSELRPDILPWQREAVLRALKEETLLINFDTGLGKTRTALEVFRHNPGRCLIVCPAGVRGTWLNQCDKWLGSSYVYNVLWTKNELPATEDICIVSYEWLTSAIKETNLSGYSTLVFDEIHYVKEYDYRKSRRSEAALLLSEANPHAIKLGLTATPVANQIEDMWHQFHVLSPGRFSSWKRFVTHYCECTEAYMGKGIIVQGLNPDTEEELNYRLNKLMIRKTKAEVAHLLPPMTVNISWHKEPSVSFNLFKLSTDALEDFSASIAPIKVRLTVDRIVEYLSGLDRNAPFKICVITHLRSTAEEIAGLVRSRLNVRDEDPVECITGELTAKRRGDAIKRACLRDRSILVATMHSIGIGIDDLKVFKNVLFAEMYWSPQVVIQTLGRFVRMGSSGDTVNVEMLALRGTVDESIAFALERKITDALKVGGVGRDGELMSSAFDSNEDEEKFLEMLREQISVVNEEDEYGLT